MKQYLEVGSVINKRGLRGEVKIECYCDSPEVLCSIKELYLDSEGKKRIKVLSSNSYKGYVYIKFEGISNVEDADKLRGMTLYADRKSIPVDENRVFIDDIIGLQVYNADTGKIYGKLTEVFNHGASDVYTVSSGEKDYYIPAVPEFVVSVNVKKGIAVRPIPGMFDDAEEI